VKFQGKHILVTGASSGIGKQISLDLAKEGAKLTLNGRDLSRLQQTRALCVDKSDVTLIPQDLRSSNFSEEISSRIVEKLDGIVLNAGLVKMNPVAYLNDEDIDNIFEVNVKSNMRLIKQLLRKKLLKNGSSIVFISSIATRKPTIGNSLYNASKSALNGFAHSLALEVAPKEIRVNTILPGYVETNILGRVRAEEEIKNHLTEYPLKRFGLPSDISSLVCFLLSDESSWITGAQIPIDGGFSMK
jgi:NAD(P)-dependent dehydrogenase (short-subunit alcohol dehydrogenase family)